MKNSLIMRNNALMTLGFSLVSNVVLFYSVVFSKWSDSEELVSDSLMSVWNLQRSVTCRNWRLWTFRWTSWQLYQSGCTAAFLCRIWLWTTTSWAMFPGSSAGSTTSISSPWPPTGWASYHSVSTPPLYVCCCSDDRYCDFKKKRQC